MTPQAVGVLGGSFDPVHLGHVALARQASRWLRLSRVLLVPCATPPHKPARRLAPAADRLAMLSLAVNDLPDVQVSALEIRRGGVSYSIDSLRLLRDGEPKCDPVFILGMDSLLEIPTWRCFETLLEEFHLLAFDRTTQRLEAVHERLHEAVRARLQRLDPDGEPLDVPPATRQRITRVYHATLPPIPASSRAIRQAACRGAALDALVPPAVAEYIQDNGIYR